MIAWLKARAWTLWAALAAALVGLVMLARVLFLRQPKEYEAEVRRVLSEPDPVGEAEAIRPRREALEAAAREIANRTPNRNVESMTADEIASEYWKLRSGGKDSK